MNNVLTSAVDQTAPLQRRMPPFPLRMELDAVRRMLGIMRMEGKTCLDVGFTHPVACAQMREMGGYWASVAHGNATRDQLAQALNEDVAWTDRLDVMPFEDKQFDVIVLALGCLSGNHETDTALIGECHRLLKVPGYLILTVEYAKPFGLARVLMERRILGETGSQYSEAALFDLLKTGFDWLGMRGSCRFFSQLVRFAVAQKKLADSPATDVLYWIARQLDVLAFISQGYLVTACGRRKGWRQRQTPLLADGRNLSDAVLIRLGK